MKKALPPHAKLSKESKECIQECVSEFISFITSHASDRGRLEKRKNTQRRRHTMVDVYTRIRELFRNIENILSQV